MSTPTIPTTPTPTPKKRPEKVPVWVLIAGIILALIAGTIIGHGSATAPSATVAAPTYTAPAVPTPNAGGSLPAVPAPSDARDNPAVPDPYTATPSGPLTTFSDGTYEVGTGDGQVAPGKYKSPGPDAGSSGAYYARLKSNEGGVDDIIKNEISQGQMLLTVQKTDKYVTVTGCTFTKI